MLPIDKTQLEHLVADLQDKERLLMEKQVKARAVNDELNFSTFARNDAARVLRQFLKIGSALIVLLGVFPSSAHAQTIPAPPVITAGVKAVFTASLDHNVVVEGNPLVASYTFDTITMTRPVPTGPLVGGALALSLSIGKPTPDASNAITIAVPSLFTSLPNGIYTSTVTAVGPSGVTATSAASDPFLKLGPPRAAGKPSIVIP